MQKRRITVPLADEQLRINNLSTGEIAESSGGSIVRKISEWIIAAPTGTPLRIHVEKIGMPSAPAPTPEAE